MLLVAVVSDAKPQTELGKKMDKARRAKTVAPKDGRKANKKGKRLIARWKRDPRRLDREGFDTPTAVGVK